MPLFPSPLERTVASALLLLSSAPPSSPPLQSGEKTLLSEENQRSSEASLSFSPIGSNSSTSDLTGDVSSLEVRAHKLKTVSVAAGGHEVLKLKVVKKSRSKVYWISAGNLKVTSVKPDPSGSMSAEASCLSTSSSAISSGRSRRFTGSQKRPTANSDELRKKRCSSAHLRRRSEAILKMLSGGGLSEVLIRRALGDTPDTSKALRMLVKLEEVKRSGTGGRRNPFIYSIA